MHEELIRERVHCCMCEGPLGGTHLNAVQLARRATWKYPVMMNPMFDDAPHAIALVCDGCLRSDQPIPFAVHWEDEDLAGLAYVRVGDLEELPDSPREILARKLAQAIFELDGQATIPAIAEWAGEPEQAVRSLLTYLAGFGFFGAVTFGASPLDDSAWRWFLRAPAQDLLPPEIRKPTGVDA